jgi:hypothetical protein
MKLSVLLVCAPLAWIAVACSANVVSAPSGLSSDPEDVPPDVDPEAPNLDADAAGASDAGSKPARDGGKTDASNVDAGKVDASAPPVPSSDVGRVQCANSGPPTYCAAGRVCCVQNAVNQASALVLTCDTFEGCQQRPDPLPLVCDGPEDCKSGEHCFALLSTTMPLTSLCSASPISNTWKRLCNLGGSGECANGETCVALPAAPGVGSCR